MIGRSESIGRFRKRLDCGVSDNRASGIDHEHSTLRGWAGRLLQGEFLDLLKGGLKAWKAKGYPVEAYTRSFQLDTIHSS